MATKKQQPAKQQPAKPSDSGLVNIPADMNIDEAFRFIQGPDSPSQAFGQDEQQNFINVIMEQAGEFKNNTLRLDVPNNKVALYVALAWQRCVEHDYAEGKEFLQTLMGLIAAKGAKRVNAAIQAVIGDREFRDASRAKGMFGRMGDFMFGKKNGTGGGG